MRELINLSELRGIIEEIIDEIGGKHTIKLTFYTPAGKVDKEGFLSCISVEEDGTINMSTI